MQSHKVYFLIKEDRTKPLEKIYFIQSKTKAHLKETIKKTLKEILREGTLNFFQQ